LSHEPRNSWLRNTHLAANSAQLAPKNPSPSARRLCGILGLRQSVNALFELATRQRISISLAKRRCIREEFWLYAYRPMRDSRFDQPGNVHWPECDNRAQIDPCSPAEISRLMRAIVLSAIFTPHLSLKSFLHSLAT
jgi:hypothetical protein